MKREIKFRGKRLDNGDWVEGDLLKNVIGVCYIVSGISDNSESEIITLRYNRVDPETVGYYTGLKDKKGVNIYEGDIINVRFGPNESLIPMQVLFKYGSWCIKEYWDDTLHDIYSYEDEIEGVIGNIFDSPELLKTE